MAFNLNSCVKKAEKRLNKFISEQAAKASSETAMSFVELRRDDTARWDAAENELTGQIKKTRRYRSIMQ